MHQNLSQHEIVLEPAPRQGTPRRCLEFVILSLLMMVLPSAAFSDGPEVQIRTSLLYPRYSLSSIRSDTTDAWAWRGELSYSQQLAGTIELALHGDFIQSGGPLETGARLYTGRVTWRPSPKMTFNIGRQFEWDPLQMLRYDGASVTAKLGQAKSALSLKAYAGLAPDGMVGNLVTTADETVWGLSLARQLAAARGTIKLWQGYLRDESQIYLGTIWHVPLGRLARIYGEGAFNLTGKSLEKVRVRSTVNLGNASLFAQLRRDEYPSGHFFPFTTVVLPARQRLLLGTFWRSGTGNLILSATVAQRLPGDGQENVDDRYLQAQVSLGGLSATMQTHVKSLFTGQVVQLAGRHALPWQLVVGWSLALGRYSIFDEDSDVIQSMLTSGLADAETDNVTRETWMTRGYLDRRGGRHLNYRLFWQLTHNRYFERDGRVGLEVTYAL